MSLNNTESPLDFTKLQHNRPDKLDTDIKRAGRLDRKIPFFYASEVCDVEAIVTALLNRHRLSHELEWERDRDQTSHRLLGYSNADLEAVVLLSSDCNPSDTL